jgi:hypothetical protein
MGKKEKFKVGDRVRAGYEGTVWYIARDDEERLFIRPDGRTDTFTAAPEHVTLIGEPGHGRDCPNGKDKFRQVADRGQCKGCA